MIIFSHSKFSLTEILIVNCKKRKISHQDTEAQRYTKGFYYKFFFFVFLGVLGPKTIEKVSNSFVKIYNEALVAEKFRLSQIAGPCCRKALEFLIKDFLINEKPKDKSKIEVKFLGKCIKQISDEGIKNMAERAAWLGNDETHYYRKWIDKDIEILKELIQLTVNYYR